MKPTTVKPTTVMLAVVLSLELSVGGWWLHSARPTVLPPVPDFSGYPMFTRNSVQQAIDSCRPEVPADWHYLADVFFAAGFYGEAECCYHRAVKMEPSRPDWRYDLGFCLSSIGRLQESDSEFRRCLVTGYGQPEQCHYLLGLNALRQQRVNDAIQAFRNALPLPAARLQLAQLAVRRGSLHEARTSLSQLQAVFPNAWQVQRLLAEVAAASGQTTEQQQHAALADIVSEPVPSPWLDFARATRARSARLGVEEHVRQIIRQAESGQRDAARQQAEAANQVLWDPLLEDVLSNLELADDRVDEQLRRLRLVIRQDGASSYRMARLGFALLAAGDQNAAVAAFQTGIHLNAGGQGQEAIDMARALSGMHRRAGRQDEAAEWQAWSLFLTGLDQLDRLQIKEAAESFDRSATLGPAPARTWFRLGCCRQLLGDDAAARQAYSECLSRAPWHERARRRLAGLD